MMIRFQNLSKISTPLSSLSPSASDPRSTSALVDEEELPLQALAKQTSGTPAKKTPIKKDTPTASASGSRNIRFTYRNSKVKKVQIIGDFNEWIPQELERGENFTWKIDLSLEPGDYAYNYMVDGRPVRDPNNQKVTDAGRGFPNSFITIKPMAKEN